MTWDTAVALSLCGQPRSLFFPSRPPPIFPLLSVDGPLGEPAQTRPPSLQRGPSGRLHDLESRKSSEPVAIPDK